MRGIHTKKARCLHVINYSKKEEKKKARWVENLNVYNTTLSYPPYSINKAPLPLYEIPQIKKKK